MSLLLEWVPPLIHIDASSEPILDVGLGPELLARRRWRVRPSPEALHDPRVDLGGALTRVAATTLEARPHGEHGDGHTDAAYDLIAL